MDRSSYSKPELGPGIAERMAVAATVTAEQSDASRSVLEQARSRVEELATPGTVLALPTTPCIAPLLSTPQQDLEKYRVGVMRLICIASISGLPQVTIPIGTLDRAPRRHFSDRMSTTVTKLCCHWLNVWHVTLARQPRPKSLRRRGGVSNLFSN
jgi:hypothetical protein